MNNELLEKIFKNRMNIIFKYLIKIGCNYTDAEDILQETFYKAIIHLEVIDDDKLFSWLFKVALNCYYDLCRKNKKVVMAPIDNDDFINGLRDINNLPENYILDGEKKIKIYKTLNQLNQVYKNLLVLKYSVGLSYKEIADILGINKNTVKTYIYRAKNKFKILWRS